MEFLSLNHLRVRELRLLSKFVLVRRVARAISWKRVKGLLFSETVVSLLIAQRSGLLGFHPANTIAFIVAAVGPFSLRRLCSDSRVTKCLCHVNLVSCLSWLEAFFHVVSQVSSCSVGHLIIGSAVGPKSHAMVVAVQAHVPANAVASFTFLRIFFICSSEAPIAWCP